MPESLRAPASILAIDDESSVLAEVTQALVSAGYTCHTCNQADQAVAMTRSILPDLIVSDINIGGASGLELCQKLRAETQLVDIPLIFLSGAQIPDIIRRAHAAGGSYYLRKPFDPMVLVDLVDRALWMPHLVQTQLAR